LHRDPLVRAIRADSWPFVFRERQNEVNGSCHAFDGATRDTGGHLPEANGLAHPSPGQGRLGGRRPGLRAENNPQAEGLPHRPAHRRRPRDAAGLQPAID
jgi:hypothetical protein